MVKGVQVLGRFEVQEILDWQDIVNDQGKVLVASWPAGANQHVEVWI